ncbi:histidine phosphatase family protein [Haladaptatus salinisoli]|uniref:histidine phosphatase family protein n=1 Tax=Haladaptatus salinisoli TaxID=2884876 RepID=UPI001D0AEBE3|nr:histidine phosphatase family protein [Haladaptatus salinisoli]
MRQTLGRRAPKRRRPRRRSARRIGHRRRRLPYARAVETVRPVADRHGLGVTVEGDFRERRLTDGPVETVGETFESAIAGVWEDWTFAWANGESSLAAQERGVRAVSVGF